MKKEKVKKALKVTAVVAGVTVECGLIFLAYLGGGHLAQDMYHEYVSNPDYMHCLKASMNDALYGWDRLFNLGICA